MPLAAVFVTSPRWVHATTHPFLASVRDGTLPLPAFDAWLVQDHHFVGDLLAFQARLLARAPRSAQRVLAAGAVSLVQELAWFEELAEDRGLSLGGPRTPATTAYGELLTRLDALTAGQSLLALWAVERAYLDAWSYAAPGAIPYRPMVAHWTAPEFAAYVAELEVAAEIMNPELTSVTHGIVEDVALAESVFWDMAMAADR